MSIATVTKYNISDRNWNHVSISPEIGDSSTFDTTNSSYAVILTFDNDVHWTGVGSISDPSDYILVLKSGLMGVDVHYSFNDNTHNYYFLIEQGDGSTFDIYLRADVVEKPLKIKKLFEKITSVLKDTNDIGTGAEIYGKNSAGTGDYSLKHQEYGNPLVNQCSGRLYWRTSSGDISATTATTTTQQNDLYVVTPSTGKITVLKTGQYLVTGKVFGYTGFTAEDRLDFRIQINDTNYASLFARERMSGTYQMIELSRLVKLTANAELNIAVQNYEAQRGIVVTTSSTILQVIRLGEV